MPNPKEFNKKEDWMDACMHQQRKVENKEQGQSVAICLNMWKDKDKKKSASRVANAFIASELEATIFTQPKYPRTKDFLHQRQEKDTAKPAERGEPFAEKGEEVIEILPGGKEVKKPYNPVTMKNKKLKLVEK